MESEVKTLSSTRQLETMSEHPEMVNSEIRSRDEQEALPQAHDQRFTSIVLGPIECDAEENWTHTNNWTFMQDSCKCGLQFRQDWSLDNFHLCNKCRSLCCRLCLPGTSNVCKACRLVTVTCEETLDRLKGELLTHGVTKLRTHLSIQGVDATIGDEKARENIIQQLASLLCCPTSLGKHEQELTWRFSEQLMKSSEGPDWFSLLAELHASDDNKEMSIRIDTRDDLKTLLEHVSEKNIVKKEMEAFDRDGNNFWLCPGDHLRSHDISAHGRSNLESQIALDLPCDLLFNRDSASSVARWAQEVKLEMRHAMCTLAVLSRAHTWSDKVVESVAKAVARTLNDVGDCSEDMLLAFMTLLMVWIMDSPRLVASHLEPVLLLRAESSEHVCTSLFWALRQLKKKPFIQKQDSKKLDYLERFQYTFYKQLGTEAFERRQDAVTFYSKLHEEWHDPTTEASVPEAWFPELGFHCAPCFEFYAEGVDVSVPVKRFRSKTNPVLFGLKGKTTHDSSIYSQKLIIKEDADVLKEQLVASFLRQLEQLWLNDPQVKSMFEKDLAISLADFSIIPRIQEVFEGVALLEAVRDAYTLKELKDVESEQSLRPVHRFLQNSNGTQPWQLVSQRFGVTSAFWIVLSSLLGLGDRHLGNVMVRKDGSLVHIDYGHILGSDATLKKLLQGIGCAGAVRVDLQDIRDVVGDDMEMAFWKPLETTFSALRSYARVLLEQLRVVEHLYPQSVDVPAFVAERCHPNSCDDDANAKFVELVRECAKGNYVNMIDLAHAQTQKQLIPAFANVALRAGTLVSSTLLGQSAAADECKICKARFANTLLERLTHPQRYYCGQCGGCVCAKCFASENHNRLPCCVQCAQQVLQDRCVQDRS